MRNLREEAIQLFDTGDQRSFDELYAGKEDLFEGVDDIIDPRFKKLFEATYQVSNLQGQKRLRESEPSSNASTNCEHNFTGAEGKPSGDGVCDGHNRPGLGGEDHCATQGQGRGDSSNASLFESIFSSLNDRFGKKSKVMPQKADTSFLDGIGEGEDTSTEELIKTYWKEYNEAAKGDDFSYVTEAILAWGMVGDLIKFGGVDLETARSSFEDIQEAQYEASEVNSSYGEEDEDGHREFLIHYDTIVEALKKIGCENIERIMGRYKQAEKGL
jgi:hypothetical protein